MTICHNSLGAHEMNTPAGLSRILIVFAAPTLFIVGLLTALEIVDRPDQSWLSFGFSVLPAGVIAEAYFSKSKLSLVAAIWCLFAGVAFASYWMTSDVDAGRLAQPFIATCAVPYVIFSIGSWIQSGFKKE